MDPILANPQALAEEFGVSTPVMNAFVERFMPSPSQAGRFASAAEVMLFVHIPKTAGISLGESLRGAFDHFHSVQWNDVGNTFRAAAREALYQQSVSPGRHVIMGHYGWPEMQMFRNHELQMKCGTVFRDPVARVVSNYNYNRSDKHPANAQFSARFPTLDSYALSLPFDPQLTQAIGFVDSFSTVLTKLTKYYTFLGLTERLSASLQHLSMSHGLPPLAEHKKNVGTKAEAEEVAPAVLSHIRQTAHNDMKLHSLLLRLYAVAAQQSGTDRAYDRALLPPDHPLHDPNWP